VADTCRCHLPFDPPLGPHWWPSRDPEPGLNVRAVALYGQTPTFLHRARALGGWRSQGAAANHPAATPPTPWASIGQCWAGTRHAVVDVTAQIAESSAAATGRNT